MQSPFIFNIGYPITGLYISSGQYRRGKAGREEAVKRKRGIMRKPRLFPSKPLPLSEEGQ